MTTTAVTAPACRPKCRHCDRWVVSRPRGLCWTCYYTDGVAERYPPVSTCGRRGAGTHNSPAPPAGPTAARPGSPEKLAVLAERVRAGQACFHPDDYRPAD